MKVRFGLAVLAASLACASAPASAYTALYAFGDSLSDAGNLYAAYGVPAPPYVDGHFSNGLTWVEDLSVQLGLGTLTPSLAGGTDFAYGGAQTGATLINPANPLPIDLPDQIVAFQSAVPTPASGALYTLDIGANDILNGLSALASGNINLIQLGTVVSQAVANTVSGIADLYNGGARNLLFYDVPQLGLTPDFNTQPLAVQALADQLAQNFNAAVLGALAPLENNGLKVFNLDTYDLLGGVVSDPSTYGFANVTDPCLNASTGMPCSTDPGVQNTYLFWDGVHPTAAGHLITAGYAYALTTPEPSTWAMMLIGFAGLGFAAFRRSRNRDPSIVSA
jgi:phospholipase/lecithinase/hemolysin